MSPPHDQDNSSANPIRANRATPRSSGLLSRRRGFPAWRGSLLIAALSGKAIVRVTLDGDKAIPAAQYPVGMRVRDLAQAPDGAVWLLEDGERGSGGRPVPADAEVRD
ncbi:PQQ-dependent sugar dehydrogenase [Sphingomonas sp. RT2P30]|uniref:PQQ-dependent sugar dehydrogenase n=1 Tax=Parasphingomonas halimpatiens TaxID=3096162 RepID=UPI002FC9E164